MRCGRDNWIGKKHKMTNINIPKKYFVTTAKEIKLSL